jgi:predicted Rossmann-fold nucleotide-binding protein
MSNLQRERIVEALRDIAQERRGSDTRQAVRQTTGADIVTGTTDSLMRAFCRAVARESKRDLGTMAAGRFEHEPTVAKLA